MKILLLSRGNNFHCREVRRQAASDGDAAREADALRVVTKARSAPSPLSSYPNLYG